MNALRSEEERIVEGVAPRRGGVRPGAAWLGAARALLLCALLPLTSATAMARAEGSDARVEEAWYVVEIEGEKAGWMREWTTPLEDRVRYSSRMRMKVSRGGVNLSIGLFTESEETPDGEPIRMRLIQELGGQAMETTYRFRDGEVRVMREQGDSSDRDIVAPPEGDWLPMGAAGRLIDERIAAGEESFSLRIVSPSTGLTPIESTYTRLEEGVVEAFGKSVPATRYRVEQRGPFSASEFVWHDEEGRMVRAEASMMGMTMSILLSEREVAVAEAPPAELLTRTFVRPSEPIEAPRKTSRAVYTVRATLEEGETLDLPETGAQRATVNEDGSIRVEVDRRARHRAPAGDLNNPLYLEASPMVDSEDPDIVAMTEKALEGGPEIESAQAARLRRWVHALIEEKSLGVGFATASQVCDARVGDCTEHAVLLAAMLRAAGIPSRVASGLIYADQFAGGAEIFAYHMWTQALLEQPGGGGVWIDLDATLPPNRPFDATHLALSVSAMSEAEPVNAMAALATGLKQVEIEVEEVERREWPVVTMPHFDHPLPGR